VAIEKEAALKGGSGRMEAAVEWRLRLNVRKKEATVKRGHRQKNKEGRKFKRGLQIEGNRKVAGGGGQSIGRLQSKIKRKG